MAELRYAQIRFKDRIAGHLQEMPDGGSVFEYRADFGETIACALPRERDRHVWESGLHPFFEHLGPEGWLRNRQARTAELDVEDDLGLLLAYGADCIGAVSVHDTDQENALPDHGRLDDLTRAAVQSRRPRSGVQPKILVARRDDRYHPAGQDDPAPYIAKFPSDDVPDLVANEDISLKATRILLGAERVTKAKRALVEGFQTPALLVERFDRTEGSKKLRLEDFAQVLGRPKRRDYSGKYDAGFEDVAAAIRAHSALPEIDVSHFFQQIFAFALIGNCDCHIKNFSLLETGAGLRLSPVYDVVNSYIYGKYGYSTQFGLRLLGERRPFDGLSRDVFDRFGREIGLNQIAIDRSIEQIARKKGEVLALVGAAGAGRDEGWAADYEQTLVSAYDRLCGDG